MGDHDQYGKWALRKRTRLRHTPKALTRQTPPLSGVEPMIPIIITGRRWFQRSYGNTYHSATIIVGDHESLSTGIHYGYGDHYLYTALELAKSKGLIPDTLTARSCDCADAGYRLITSVADVAREKDL
jgi:hypothetical protein